MSAKATKGGRVSRSAKELSLYYFKKIITHIKLVEQRWTHCLLMDILVLLLSSPSPDWQWCCRVRLRGAWFHCDNNRCYQEWGRPLYLVESKCPESIEGIWQWIHDQLHGRPGVWRLVLPKWWRKNTNCLPAAVLKEGQGGVNYELYPKILFTT